MYLPIHKNVPLSDMKKICEKTVEVVNIVNNIKGKKCIQPKL